MNLLRRLRIDPYIFVLLGTIAVAALLPVRGEAAEIFSYFVSGAIALLFFLYGAKLSPKAVIDGLAHWRLQGIVFLATYALFPLAGLLIATLSTGYLSPDLRAGILFLSVLPSTVQSSIAFTSIAHGNVAAALTSASLSNLTGVFLTPILVSLLLGAHGGFDASSVLDIAMQILLPFILGQIARPLIGAWLKKHGKVTSLVDRGVIVLVVYSAFSEGMVEGIWSRIELGQLLWMALFCALLLGVVMTTIALVVRVLNFNREDRIAIQFCGSKKSLATGIPMAGILFGSQSVAMMVLPLMFFHQLQLFVCAILAQQFASRRPVEPEQAVADHAKAGA